jgi:hypothetical protein
MSSKYLWSALLALLVCACSPTPTELGVFQPPPPPTTSIVVSDTVVNAVDAQPVASEPIDIATLRSDFVRVLTLRKQCGRQPDKCDVSSFIVPGSALHVGTAKLMQERTAGNIRSRAGAGTYRFRIESLLINDISHALVHTCSYDSVVLFDSGQLNSTADDIVFNNHTASNRTAWSLEMHAGHWKWVSGEVLESFFGGDICGF